MVDRVNLTVVGRERRRRLRATALRRNRVSARRARACRSVPRRRATGAPLGPQHERVEAGLSPLRELRFTAADIAETLGMAHSTGFGGAQAPRQRARPPRPERRTGRQPLRARVAGRARPHRRQEARPRRRGGAPHQRPAHAAVSGRRRRAGSSCTSASTMHGGGAPGLRRGARRRTRRHRLRVPRARTDRLVRPATASGRAGDDPTTATATAPRPRRRSPPPRPKTPLHRALPAGSNGEAERFIRPSPCAGPTAASDAPNPHARALPVAEHYSYRRPHRALGPTTTDPAPRRTEHPGWEGLHLARTPTQPNTYAPAPPPPPPEKEFHGPTAKGQEEWSAVRGEVALQSQGGLIPPPNMTPTPRASPRPPRGSAPPGCRPPAVGARETPPVAPPLRRREEGAGWTCLQTRRPRRPRRVPGR